MCGFRTAIAYATVVVILLADAAPAQAQSASTATGGVAPDAMHLTFDVVSIKRSPPGPGPTMIISPPASDRIIVAHAPPREIIGEAFGIRLHDEITGLPVWAESEAYDIEAKVAESDVPAFHRLLPMERNPMLQSILKTRFHLASHFETKILPAYALVVSKGGPKLKEIEPGVLPSGLKDPGGIDMSRSEITAKGASMLPLIHVLQLQLGRPVVDRTGLTGHYDFKLNFTPDNGGPTALPGTESGPSIFTAIQEQLGLKLEPVKAPIPILVIDHIERPSEN